ncbi:MAG: Mu transposase C-terminal domain-containing protein [Desulfitobacteriaceae bacterium]|nr:Mu transposase C-terminal domain-containing protein [Desulfitobacteriaceae bacterium]
MYRLNHERQKIQEFRKAIVLELRDLEPAERSRMIDELTGRTLHIPFSRKRNLSRAVIYQWLKEYRESLDQGKALLPKKRKDRDTFRRLSDEQKAALMKWRQENAYRSAAQLREELMAHPETNTPPIPSESTIVRYLRSLNLDRNTLLQQGSVAATTRLSYESPYPQWLWLADTKGPNLYVIDPTQPERMRLAKPIVFLDDCARFVVAAWYVFEDNEEWVMHLFKGAIAAYGIPNSLYVDRGSPYMGKSLKRSATLLGCKIIHTRPRDAPAKGKAEKIMRLFYEQLETELALKELPLTIEQANEYTAALISRDYHRSIHSETKQTPEERFFQFPSKYRRFVSQETLAMIFLPCTRSKVSKTGLIHLNKEQYLVPDIKLYKEWVEVRFDPMDQSKVYVWWRDNYYGEAFIYVPENDYAKRGEYLERLKQLAQAPKPQPLLDQIYVPPYSRLERQLAEYRQELAERDLNAALAKTLARKEQIKAELTPLVNPPPTASPVDTSPVVNPSASPQSIAKAEVAEFGLDRCVYLLSVLLKRSLDARERLSLTTVWRHYGPFTEVLVRQTVGRLLGEGHPVSDLMGYLDALRLAAGKTNTDT